jgi:hypothetical protein
MGDPWWRVKVNLRAAPQKMPDGAGDRNGWPIMQDARKAGQAARRPSARRGVSSAPQPLHSNVLFANPEKS